MKMKRKKEKRRILTIEKLIFFYPRTLLFIICQTVSRHPMSFGINQHRIKMRIDRDQVLFRINRITMPFVKSQLLIKSNIRSFFSFCLSKKLFAYASIFLFIRIDEHCFVLRFFSYLTNPCKSFVYSSFFFSFFLSNLSVEINSIRHIRSSIERYFLIKHRFFTEQNQFEDRFVFIGINIIYLLPS